MRDELSKLDSNDENAVIGYVHDSDVLDEGAVGGSLKDIDFMNCADSLSNHGYAFKTKESLKELIEDFKKKISFDIDDHQAWSIYTTLSVAKKADITNEKLEANIHESESKIINNKPIDLTNSEAPLKLITCKFKVQNQQESANERMEELSSLELDGSRIGLGTYSLQPRDRIESYISEVEYDFLIIGSDLMNLG